MQLASDGLFVRRPSSVLRKVKAMLRSIVLVWIFLAAVLAVPAQTADDIKPPNESATRAEQEKWLTQALIKYGKYKNASTSVSIASAKINVCIVSFNVIRKPTSIDSPMDRTVVRTNKVTQSVSIDLSRIADDGVAIEEFLDPNLRTLVVKSVGEVKTEVVVERKAAAAIRVVLERLRAECRPER